MLVVADGVHVAYGPRGDYRRVAELVRGPAGPWEPEAIEAMLAPFFEEHERVRTDPDARSPKNVQVEAEGNTWKVLQTLLDPEAHGDFQLVFDVPIDASREEGDAVLVLLGRAES